MKDQGCFTAFIACSSYIYIYIIWTIFIDSTISSLSSSSVTSRVRNLARGAHLRGGKHFKQYYDGFQYGILHLSSSWTTSDERQTTENWMDESYLQPIIDVGMDMQLIMYGYFACPVIVGCS